MNTNCSALMQQENDKRAALLLVLVIGLMLLQIIALGAIAVARAHEGAWIRAAVATVPAVLAIGASVKALVRSSGDHEGTFKIAGVGFLAWSAGAALQAVAIVAAPAVAQWFAHF